MTPCKVRGAIMCLRLFIVVALSTVLLGGCAARTLSLGQCAAIGAAAAGGGGAAAANEVDDDWIGAGVAIGAVAGAAAGWLICNAIPEAQVVEAEVPPEPEPEPEAPPPPPPAGRARIVLRGANFSFDSAEIDEGSRVVLDVAAETLNANPEVGVRVEGHTDATGPAEYNRILSRRRAQAVRDVLVNAGVASSRLEIVAWGEERPLASNDNAAGRRINRRVQLVTVD